MTQAYNLSQLANNLNSSGQLDATDGLVNAVPVINGGTGASNASTARSNLGLVIGTDIPSTTGSGASGTWSINITGNSSTANRAFPRRSDGGDLNFYWSGQSGQPTWLWGGNDGTNMYVYNPSNFSVNYATTSGTATNSIGVGQTWQTPSRSPNTVYQNTTSKPIQVNCYTTALNSSFQVSADGSNWTLAFGGSTGGKSVIVQSGFYYRLVNDNNQLSYWYELI